MLEFHGVRGLQFRLAGMMSRSMISRPIWAKISHNRPSVCLRFSTDSAQGSKFSEALAMKPSGALGDRAAALAAEMESNKAVEGTIAVRRQKGIFGQIVKWGLLSGVAVGAAYTYFNYDEVVAFTAERSLSSIFSQLSDPELDDGVKQALLSSLFITLPFVSAPVLKKAGEVGGVEAAWQIIQRSRNTSLVISALSLTEILCRDGLCRLLVASNDEFLKKLLTMSQDFRNVDISRMAITVVLAIAKDSSLAEKLVGAGILEVIEKLMKPNVDLELVNRGSFIAASLLKGFPDRFADKLSDKQKDLVFNAGYNLGMMFQQQQKYQTALEVFQDLDRFLGQNPFPKLALGLAYKDMGDHPKANMYFRQALKLNPYFMECRANLARNLIENGGLAEKNEAVKILYDGLQSHRYQPAVVELYVMLANVLEELKKNDQAARVLRELVNLQPKNVKALNMLGKILLKNGDTKASLNYLKKAQKLQPHDSQCWFYLGLAYNRLKDFTKAKEALEKAVSLNPSIENGKGQFLLGKSLMKEKKFVEAATCFEKYGQIRSFAPEAHFEAAVAYELARSFERANEKFLETMEVWEKRSRRMGLKNYFDKHGEELNALKKIQSRCDLDLSNTSSEDASQFEKLRMCEKCNSLLAIIEAN